jgi:hypothetical protein
VTPGAEGSCHGIHTGLPRKFGDQVRRNQIAKLPEYAEFGCGWFGLSFFHLCRVAELKSHANHFFSALAKIPMGCPCFLAAFPLAMIAITYLLYQSARRPSAKEFLKAMMLAVAFLFWAANQLWPDLPQATLFNDIAIVLFVLDVFLVIIGWPTTSPDESFAETYIEKS